ncbi:hypothetical protein [Streptomyces sp. NPDC088925]|uniref:hypothetical protein n=1 Tax=Streptomyces sp. NPDC088925 TaxID=3365914 RepID=UPI0038183308
MSKPIAPHGTLSRHKHHGCKCQPCYEAFRQYTRSRYRRIGYGTWNPLADAAPVRAHIDALRAAGHTMTGITLDADVSSATIARIYYMGAPTVRTEVAERILSLKPTDAPRLSPHSAVDGTGTRRRIQALAAMGWPFTALGGRLGVHPRRLSDLARADRVSAATAKRIADAYRTLHTLNPAQHGVGRQAITMARNFAARQNWHGPLAWDDIDDPNATPWAGEEPQLNRNELAAVRRQEIEHLAGFGLGAEEIAARLGDDIAVSTVKGILADLRNGPRDRRKEVAA